MVRELESADDENNVRNCGHRRVHRLAASSQSFAAEAMLFRATSFVSPAAEAGLFTSREKETIRLRREGRFTKQVLVVGFNSEALQSSDISLEMPDHSIYRFNGVVQPGLGTPGYFTWKEAWMLPVPASAVPKDAAAVVRSNGTSYPNSLELFFDRGRENVLGRLAIGNRRFDLMPLNAKYMTLLEHGLNPSSPPIDAEPPGPRPSRLRPSPDWPRGLLSEKLRESISTSSIGASLSPEHCNQVTSCGEVTMISCHPEVDGPEMYFNNISGRLIMACGGACMGGAGLPDSKLCTACPPPQWSKCKGSSQ